MIQDALLFHIFTFLPCITVVHFLTTSKRIPSFTPKQWKRLGGECKEFDRLLLCPEPNVRSEGEYTRVMFHRNRMVDASIQEALDEFVTRCLFRHLRSAFEDCGYDMVEKWCYGALAHYWDRNEMYSPRRCHDYKYFHHFVNVSVFRWNYFENEEIIPRIIVPTGVIRIEAGTFSGKYVAEVVFAEPTTLKYIGKNAFADNHIQSLVIPDSVVSIEDGAFARNDLQRLSLPKKVRLGVAVFKDNPSLSRRTRRYRRKK